ncbi:MAG: CCA tRNA nucleotidyltransferase, partial [Thermodesulfobacteriota bacterium]
MRLRERGFSAFLVGGALRNAILGLQIEDWDVATEASWQVVMSMFPKVIPSGVRHGTVTVVLGPVRVEVSSFKGDGILDDLGHRDFTIDAMAWDPVSDSLMDPHGGMRDLKARVVRG